MVTKNENRNRNRDYVSFSHASSIQPHLLSVNAHTVFVNDGAFHCSRFLPPCTADLSGLV